MADPKMENGNDSHTLIASKSKLQPTIEYISTFAVALLLLAIILAIVAITLFGNNGGQPPVASSCFISAQLDCVQFQIANNGVAGSAVIVFSNNLGTTMYFPSSNAIKFSPAGSQTYVGNCYPANAVPGSTVICNATFTGYSPSIGSQLEPTFQIKYSQCAGCTQLNTSGSGIAYVSSPVSLYTVQLLSSPVLAPYRSTGFCTLPVQHCCSSRGHPIPSQKVSRTVTLFPVGPPRVTTSW